MRNVVRVFAVASLLAVPAVSYAQGPSTPEKRQALEERRKQIGERRQEMQKQREELLQQRREEMGKRRGEMKEQREEMMAARRQLLDQFHEFQHQIRERVQSGQLTKEQALSEVRAWRESHKPPRPEGVKPRP